MLDVGDHALLDAVARGAEIPREKLDEFGKDTPLGRMGQPAELAPAYVFLASAESSYVLGETLNHVNLALVWALPLIVLVVVRLVEGSLRPRRAVQFVAAGSNANLQALLPVSSGAPSAQLFIPGQTGTDFALAFEPCSAPEDAAVNAAIDNLYQDVTRASIPPI